MCFECSPTMPFLPHKHRMQTEQCKFRGPVWLANRNISVSFFIYHLMSSVYYLQLFELKTFRDSVPKPLVYRDRVKGNARLNTLMLIVVTDWSYHPGPGLCLSAMGTLSYFVPFSAKVRRMLGVRVRMWLLAAYVPSLLMPSTAAYAPGPGVLRILNTKAKRKRKAC